MNAVLWLVITGGILVLCVLTTLSKSGSTITLTHDEEVERDL